MKLRTTIVLLALFAAGLGVLWYADYAAIPTREQRALRANRLIPELIDTPPDEVRRLEIVRKGEEEKGKGKDEEKEKEKGKRVHGESGRLVVVRREGGGWQLVEPVDSAADPNLVETLVRNLKDLQKSPDAGTIRDDPAPYGLDTPRARVAIYGKETKAPLATLDLGKTKDERAYVRPGPEKDAGIEVVDARLLNALTLPVADWRDKALVRVPSFRVAGLSIREAAPDRERVAEVRRDERQWRMVRPVKAPADNDKVEGLVAELAALRVADGNDGFVAEAVRDLAPYGLDKPSMTISVTPYTAGGATGTPQILELGKAVPDKPNQVYARRGDQDDVVRVEVKTLREAYKEPTSLRSQQIVDINPGRVFRVRIETLGQVFDLSRTAEGWELLSPVREAADAVSVKALLTELGEVKTSEFFEPTRVNDPRLDPPLTRVRVWQTEPGATLPAPASSDTPPEGEPRADLRLGRHDAVKKTVYGKLEGDTSDKPILALTDKFLSALPKNEFAYRDLAVVRFGPEQVRRLTVERPGSEVTVQAPGSGSTATHWRMVEPVDAPADEQAVTGLLMGLSNLRAERWVRARVGDGREYGLDAPRLRVKWTLETESPDFTGSKLKAKPKTPPPAPTTKVLRIGRASGPMGPSFANIEGDPKVFSLPPATVEALGIELHDRTVLQYPGDKVERVVFRWPTRTLALRRPSETANPGAPWQPEPGYDPSGFDPSRVGAIVTSLSDLKTPRFFQYRGAIPSASGLLSPRLTLQVWTDGAPAPKELKVGAPLGDSQAYATTSPGAEGAVFALPTGPAWDALIRTPTRPGDLPDDVFTPSPGPNPAKPPG
jgi:hypothetical protein